MLYTNRSLEAQNEQFTNSDGPAPFSTRLEACMESPLTQQPRPEAFQQKVVRLYETLFQRLAVGSEYSTHTEIQNPQDEDEEGLAQTEGFWQEFFLLRPDRTSLRRILDELGPEELLEREDETRELFARAIAAMKRGSKGIADIHALETLCTFFIAVVAKKYTNPTSDIIDVLAGLDQADQVFSDFVGALEGLIRAGKDKGPFPSSDEADVVGPFCLVGLLANYNKFEFQNPYQLRLNDFVNEATIQKILRGVGNSCQLLRDQYTDIQEDHPEGWSLSYAFSMIGLGAITSGSKPPPKPTYDAETAKKMFAALPGERAAMLLATYDFAHANKLFCFNLVTLPAETKGEETPFASFTSLTSYLLQHAHLTERATVYSHLNLMVFRLLIEDPTLCKRMCSEDKDAQITVRLCRQRQPHLPLVRGERSAAAAVMDTMVDGINHNLRRRLDSALYALLLGILLRVISHMSRTRTRLQYHWSELFRSLLSLVRFLTTYAADLKGLTHVDTILDHVVNLLALGLSSGEAFLPSPAAYDDLFYKIVESGDMLVKFRDTYGLSKRSGNSIDTLVDVGEHYKRLLAENGGGSGANNRVTSMQVTEVIKQGYESLSIQAKEGLDSWERYREADERRLLKKVARTVVAD
ncbi:hypothetical protein OOU_Y34scaffold00793g10 [Pyricularia oryzae Y34]|uniref:Armadillo-like helical domain-containing protein n=1 Tax=Pyricularia oryzae (strain Y34) TaxID=1143189 RepID=A0AA97NQ23_PYRO3|nr:hypothetical protein OOU_Y34scaffold00793g10 [Pyricularia oryzae Y34]